MRKLLSLLGLVLFPLAVWSQTISNAEYFFDADPGAGNGTSMTISSPGATVTFTTSIPTTSLPTGFHILGLRVKQSDDVWSIFETRGFYISTAATTIANLASAEFFFDVDPGAGNATAITIPPGATASFTIPISASALSPGFHFLAIRVKDSSGLWGVFECRGFYISDNTDAAADISGAEYFFDSDPGVGNGTSLTVPSGTTSAFTVSLPASGLAPGFHVLAIRVKGADGQWGIFENRSFYISADIGSTADIVAAEYFVNADPGIGNGTTLTVNPTGPTINQNFTIVLPNTLGEGTHTLSLRVQSADGIWSEHETQSFDIIVNDPPIAQAGTDNAITLPVNTVSLDGSPSSDPDGTIASFLWTKISGPAGENILQTTSALTDVENLSRGVYTFELLVTDDKGFIDRDTIQITVNPEPNELPVANAGVDQSINLPVTTVTLSGAASSDTDGTLVTFAWTQLSGPVGAVITSPDDISTDVTSLTIGVYSFQLTVTDNKGATDTDVDIITVNASSCPPIPLITQIENRLVCNPPGDSYQWLLNGEPISGETAQLLTINYIAYGAYRVVLTDAGCSATSSEYMYLITDAETTDETTSIFPNPVLDDVIIKTTVALPAKITIVDRLGRKITETTISTPVHEMSLPALAQGIYFIVVNGKSWYKIQKL